MQYALNYEVHDLKLKLKPITSANFSETINTNTTL